LLDPASVSASLAHASQILEQSQGDLFQLAAFLGPQHSFLGETQDNMVEWQGYRHPRLGIPVLVACATTEERALFTRDRRLLMHAVVRDGYYPRSQSAEEQTRSADRLSKKDDRHREQNTARTLVV
jgi:hypothetical protein